MGKHLGKLELIADFLARRDVDNDGLVEATQSGNRGTSDSRPALCAWWDALNCGHKDAYCNALSIVPGGVWPIWRRKLAVKSNRPATRNWLQTRRPIVPTLLNPETGWLAWWKSADGERHDYARLP